MRNDYFRFFACVFAFLSLVCLTACGGGGGGRNPAASVTQTGTLQGTVSLPSTLLTNIVCLASDTNNIASDTQDSKMSLRANQSLEGTKVWLEDYPEITGIADKDGNYTLSKVPFGENRVVANIKIGDDEYKWRSDIQNVTSTAVIIVPQIVMRPANTSISGTIYNGMTKEPIQGVIVEVWGQKSTSMADGKYTVYNMPAGSWDVTYSKTGYQTFKSPMSFAEGIETVGNFYLVPDNVDDTNFYDINIDRVSLALDMSHSFNAKSDLNFRIFGDGNITDISSGIITFSCGSVKGRLSINNGNIVFKLEEGQEWPVGKEVTGHISGFKDNNNNDIDQCDFSFYVNYFEGDGTEENPFLINNADDLNKLRDYVSSKDYYFKQTQDIDLTDYGTSYDNGKGWMPIPSDFRPMDILVDTVEKTQFYGVYDGNNHKITNLYINRPQKCVGLFNTINGTVKNLGIELSANGIKGACGGALVYQINCFDKDINNCWVGGTGGITCDYYHSSCAGLVFLLPNAKNIVNCYSTIDVKGYECGGLFGNVLCENISNCYSSGNVKFEESGGGLINNLNGNIKNSYSTSNVSGEHCGGGLIYKFKGNMENCYSLGNLTITTDGINAFVGGLVCEFWGGKISRSFSTSNCDASNNGYSGGFICSTRNNSVITNCYAKGNVSGDVAGGFVCCFSDENSNLINSFSLGNVSGVTRCGGFVGSGVYGVWDSGNVIKNCYAGCQNIEGTGNIKRFISFVSPQSSINMTNCYANKNMTVINNGVPTQSGLQNPLPETVSTSGVDGANLPDNPNWKNQIFKDGYENGESFDSVWQIGVSGLPTLKNMPGNPVQ